ncbi:MAG: tyrosine-type recombinase/integrase [Dehalococcoidia bacterium]
MNLASLESEPPTAQFGLDGVSAPGHHEILPSTASATHPDDRIVSDCSTDALAAAASSSNESHLGVRASGCPNQEGRRRIDALDEALPHRADAGWWQSGVLVAGDRKRRRPQSPTLDPSDLERIVDAAGKGVSVTKATRDRVLVATHCHSGLLSNEIRTLRWDALRWIPEAEAWTTAIGRGRGEIEVSIYGRAASLIVRWRLESRHSEVYVLANSHGEPLAARQVRRIVLDACTAAGFPRADRSTLLSAAAADLSASGLTDHEVAAALGIVDMRTMNRLLKPHQALAAQRLIRA